MFNKTNVLSILCFLSMTIISKAYADRDYLVFASVPYKSPKALHEMYAPLIEHLETGLGKKVVFRVTNDYEEMSKRIISKTVDIASLGANSYIEAKQKIPGLRYLATTKLNGNDHYYSLILTSTSSGITTISDLKGKKFAMTDVQSTSGYVYPSIMLNKAGIDPSSDFSQLFMLKKHSKIYDAIVSGAIDAGGCSATQLVEKKKEHGDVFKIIERSDPIPMDPVTVAPHLDIELTEKIRTLLSSFENSDPESILTGYSVRSDAYYDVVREAKAFGVNN